MHYHTGIKLEVSVTFRINKNIHDLYIDLYFVVIYCTVKAFIYTVYDHSKLQMFLDPRIAILLTLFQTVAYISKFK